MSDVITPSGLPNELTVITNDNTLVEVFNPDTGANEKAKVSTIKTYSNAPDLILPEWNELTTYSTKGTLVDRYGRHYTSTGAAGNLNKDPSVPANAKLYWRLSEGSDKLEFQANDGKPVSAGMHVITDRSHAQYAQNILLDQIKKGAITYNLSAVMLDGTVVTGDATLEAIFDVGGANEYPYLDLYAPDVLGTRTLLDMGGHVTEAMTALVGVVPTLAEIHDDYVMTMTGDIEAADPIQNADSNGVLSTSSGIPGSGRIESVNVAGGSRLLFNSSNSIFPNPIKTNDDRTAHAALVVGASYIVVEHAA